MHARRVAFKLLTAASVLLAVALLGLWAQSYQQIDQFTFHPYHVYRADSGDGVLCLEFFRVIKRERDVKIERDVKMEFVPLTRRAQVVPLSEFVETPVGYGDSQYAKKRAVTPISTPWWGKTADWRIVPLVDQWSRDQMSRVVWVQNLVPQCPQMDRISLTIDDSLQGYAAVQTQKQEQLVGRALWLPYWFLLLPCAIFPLLSVRNVIRARRRQRLSLRNLCPNCGYDLRATPDRCPECGHGHA